MPDKAPGCTFVWSPHHKEVRDLRLYIEIDCRGQGYGHLIVSFAKAFFFPFISSASGPEQGALQIPFGSGGLGSKALFMSVLPVTTLSRQFYRNQGFVTDRSSNKWLFRPPEIQQLYSCRVIDWTFGFDFSASASASAGAASASDIDVVIDTSSAAC